VPGQDPLHISVENGCVPAKGDGEDGSRCISADARKTEQVVECLRDPSSELIHDPLSGPVQVPCSGIVAETFPDLQDPGKVCPGQVPNRGKRFQEPVVIGDDRRNLGLLQHDLRDPDGIGVVGPSPGKIPCGLLEPPEELTLDSLS